MMMSVGRSRRAKNWSRLAQRAALVLMILGVGGVVATPTAAVGPLGAAPTTTVMVAGRGGVPLNHRGVVEAVAVNVTATRATAPTFAIVWPSGTTRPESSNLNLEPDRTVANLVISALGADGSLSIFVADGDVDLIVDVVGWFPVGGSLRTLAPSRLVDTRRPPVARMGAATTRRVEIAGRSGIPTNAVAVVANLTAVGATTETFLTAWPSGMARPVASNLNPTSGRTTANLAVVPIGSDGAISVYNHAGSVDVIIDVVGWFGAADANGAPSTFSALGPTRALDLRPGRLRAGSVLDVMLPGRAGVIPTGVGSVLVNLTATNAAAATFVSVGSPGQANTATSALNLRGGDTVANLMIVPPTFSLFTSAADLALIVDVLGWFPPGAGFLPSTPTRLLDTRRPEPQRVFPVRAGVEASFGFTHAGYPATDIFAACGAELVAPVTGTVVLVRRVDNYYRATDNPALRGGKAIAILGDDRVRYYGSHYDVIDPHVVVGARVTAGDRLGTMGKTGDTSVCHLHFGLSPMCAGPEWSVRRGTIWPGPYLTEWRRGVNRSPASEVASWSTANPSACAVAMADPNAAAV